MYESPINLYTTDITTQVIRHQEEQILKAVQSIVVDVNHEELFRALKYDRGQYEKGYQDGMADAKPKWIPVAERLPEASDYYLYKAKGMYRGLKDGVGVSYFMHKAKKWQKTNGDFVTHWMPLPELPQEADNA